MSSDLIFVLVMGSVLIGAQLERWRARWWRREYRSRRFERPTLSVPTTDAAEQLRIVMAANFDRRPILTRTETRVLLAAEQAIAAAGLPWRVMAQVCLGEVLRTSDRSAYSAINSKRVDLLVVTRSGEPLAAIEYQGRGHYQSNAPARDAVKREALRKAGIRYIEMTPEHGPSDIAAEFSRMIHVDRLKAQGNRRAPPAIDG